MLEAIRNLSCSLDYGQVEISKAKGLVEIMQLTLRLLISELLKLWPSLTGANALDGFLYRYKGQKFEHLPERGNKQATNKIVWGASSSFSR